MRRWLSLYALSVTSIVIVAFLVPLAILIRDLSADRALSAAEREAQAVARFVATTPVEATDALGVSLESIAGLSVLLPNGDVLGAELPPHIDLDAAEARVQAYRQPLADGEAVVVPVLRDVGEVWVVVVGVTAEELTENVTTAWLILGGLGVSMMVLALAAADQIGQAVLRPVKDLVEATHELGRGNLAVRVVPTGPRELREVGSAFNSLTDRVVSLMNRERESAAELAHRLRTPLTALKLDIEAVGRSADVARLQRDVDDLERVTTRIIDEARRPLRSGGSCDIVSVLRERSDFWGALADDQGRPWSLELALDHHVVAASASDVEAALDAVFGNIFAHTPAGTSYRIHLQLRNGIATLSLSDDGPGIAAPELLLRGASGGASTGLGADIVRGFAEQLGGTARWLAAESGGTLVEIELPSSTVR